MKASRALVALLLAWFAVASAPGGAPATEVLLPPFFSGERELLDRAATGQFGTLLEVHLLQYAADPPWRAEWARDRYTRSGFLMQYGSITATKLHVDREIAVNIPLEDRFGLGYERREWQDGRFELFDERLHARWSVTDDWALVVAGWPTHRKSEASFGLGTQVGAGRDGWLRVLVLDEAFVHDSKSGGKTKFDKQPVRYLADGYLRRGRLTLHGSLNLGEPYRVRALPGEEGDSLFRGTVHTLYGSLGAEFEGEGWGMGFQGRFVVDRLAQRERSPGGEGTDLELGREWSLVEAHVRRRWGPWSGSALLGYGRQRDEHEVPGEEGNYRMDQGLYGFEGGYTGWDPLEVRAGYLGSYSRMEREVDLADPDAPLALRARREVGYADKVHLKAIYRLRPQLALEALISKEVTRGAFGGFGVKALAVF